MPSPIPSDRTPESFRTYLEVKDLPNTGPVQMFTCQDSMCVLTKVSGDMEYAHVMCLNRQETNRDTCLFTGNGNTLQIDMNGKDWAGP